MISRKSPTFGDFSQFRGKIRLSFVMSFCRKFADISRMYCLHFAEISQRLENGSLLPSAKFRLTKREQGVDSRITENHSFKFWIISLYDHDFFLHLVPTVTSNYGLKINFSARSLL